MTVPHQTGRVRMPGTTMPSGTNGCTDSVLARSSRAAWHDRAEEIFVARVARAVEHARATAASAAAALRVRKEDVM